MLSPWRGRVAAWLLVLCGAGVLGLGACSVDSDSAPSGGTDVSAGSDANVEHWFDTWCSVKTGMSKDTIIDLMGTPTGGSTDPSFPTITWVLPDGVSGFRVDLDSDGEIAQGVLYNDDGFTAAQKQKVACGS